MWVITQSGTRRPTFPGRVRASNGSPSWQENSGQVSIRDWEGGSEEAPTHAEDWANRQCLRERTCYSVRLISVLSAGWLAGLLKFAQSMFKFHEAPQCVRNV